jgi:predicted acyl esterase
MKNIAKISRFGEYQGYSEATYDSHVRRSDYLTLSDGTKLAYDVLLPTRKGVLTDDPLPVLFMYTTYLKAVPQRQPHPHHGYLRRR